MSSTVVRRHIDPNRISDSATCASITVAFCFSSVRLPANGESRPINDRRQCRSWPHPCEQDAKGWRRLIGLRAAQTNQTASPLSTTHKCESQAQKQQTPLLLFRQMLPTDAAWANALCTGSAALLVLYSMAVALARAKPYLTQQSTTFCPDNTRLNVDLRLAGVVDDVPASNKHWVNVLCLLGDFTRCQPAW